MDKKTTKNILTIIFIAILLIFALWHFETLFSLIAKFFKIIRPVIIGFAIAFVLKNFFTILENQYKKLFKKIKSGKVAKILAIISVYLIVFAILTGINLIIIPQLAESITMFKDNYVKYLDNAEQYISNFTDRFDIESLESFDIKSKIQSSGNLYKFLMSGDTIRNDEMYSLVLDRCNKFIDSLRQLTSVGINGRSNSNKYSSDLKNQLDCLLSVFKDDLEKICKDEFELVDYLVEIFYIDKPSFNKNLLWGAYGKEIFENVKNNNKGVVVFPIPNKNGDIEYLNQKYKLGEVFI